MCRVGIVNILDKEPIPAGTVYEVVYTLYCSPYFHIDSIMRSFKMNCLYFFVYGILPFAKNAHKLPPPPTL